MGEWHVTPTKYPLRKSGGTIPGKKECNFLLKGIVKCQDFQEHLAASKDDALENLTDAMKSDIRYVGVLFEKFAYAKLAVSAGVVVGGVPVGQA